MPGLNQKGPENMGPMTGRQMGRCVTRETQPYGRGRGCGRGFGPRGLGSWGAPAMAVPTKEDLSLRAEALEQELEAVKKELRNYSKE